MQIRQVTSDTEARALAQLLNGDERSRPIVVVTTPAQHAAPFIDPDQIASELGDLAEVYLIETGPHTWTFSAQMAPLTQVYGGAGRVYPLGREWLQDPYQSPLRFAYDAAEGKRSTQLLIDDGLDMAAAGGLIGRRRDDQRHQRVEGVVHGIVSERALVRIPTGMVTVPPQLAAPGVPIERVLSKGMVVTGEIETNSRWLDIRGTARSAENALASYQVGDVVLAQVTGVNAGTADLHLHPDQAVTVDRRDVTGDLSGDLRSLLTEGEVLPARIAEVGPSWKVTLYDADDEPRAAVALFDDGPPWLEPPTEDEQGFETPDVPRSTPKPAAAQTPAAAAKAPPRPAASPLVMDPRRRSNAAREPAPPPAATYAAPRPGAIDGLKDKIRTLESTVQGLEQENAQLLDFKRNNEARIEQQGQQLASLRKQLRKQKGQSTAVALPEFADRERGFRHAVEHAWATRTPLAEQAARPLHDYAIGPNFIDSIDSIEGVSVSKVADVVFEVITGLAATLDSRDMHRLRTGPGGGDPAHVRGDGAVCWRVALQQNSPSARRLHFWRLTDESIELSRVVLHDDMTP